MPRLTGDRPATLAVLGDGASNDMDEWVNLMGQRFGEERRTRVQRLNQAGAERYNAPIRYGDKAPDLTVWNASLDGASPELASDQVSRFLPERPDLVILSHGRHVEARSVAAQLTRTRERVAGRFPHTKIIVVLQPPQSATGPAQASLAAVREWAANQGLPIIDVARAFAQAPPAIRLQEAGPDPALTPEGQALWASTVHDAIAATPTAHITASAATTSASTASAAPQPSR